MKLSSKMLRLCQCKWYEKKLIFQQNYVNNFNLSAITVKDITNKNPYIQVDHNSNVSS